MQDSPRSRSRPPGVERLKTRWTLLCNTLAIPRRLVGAAPMHTIHLSVRTKRGYRDHFDWSDTKTLSIEKKKREERGKGEEIEIRRLFSEPAAFNSGDRPRGRHESDRRPGCRYGRAIIRPVTVQGAAHTQRGAFGMTERGPHRDAYPRVEIYSWRISVTWNGEAPRRSRVPASSYSPRTFITDVQGVSKHVWKMSRVISRRKVHIQCHEQDRGC